MGEMDVLDTEIEDGKAPIAEQRLLRTMLAERGFEVGLRTAEVYYHEGKRDLMIAEDFDMSEKTLREFRQEYERRAAHLDPNSQYALYDPQGNFVGLLKNPLPSQTSGYLVEKVEEKTASFLSKTAG